MGERPLPALTVFLQPGELVTAETPMRVKTVVGSCLAIMIRAPGLGIAAIAHCLLPEAEATFGPIPREQALRYVDTTVDLMLRDFSRRGAGLYQMEIKLFGGADGLCGVDTECGCRVGGRNVECARKILAARGLTAAAWDVGGTCGRVIEFDTETGEVFVRKLPPQKTAQPAKRT